MKQIFAFALLLGGVGLGLNAVAQDKVLDWSKLQLAGPGCPATADAPKVQYSERSGRLLVYFNSMKVELSDRSIDRKACSLALPIVLPPGKTLSLGKPAVFGRVELSDQASLLVEAEVFEAGQKGPKASKEFNGSQKVARDFYARESETIEAECGSTTILRANVTALARKAAASASGEAEVEGVALTAKLQDCAVR